MLRILLLTCLLFSGTNLFSKTIIVKNNEELAQANKQAQPGDIIILQNGEWKQATLLLNCNGTKENPVTFKAETPGKVMITGNSKLKIGGNYLIVDGLYFTNGYAGKDAVISFRTNKNEIASNCRVTNIVINDFNNPKRLDENYWVELYGKNNRVDHCSFFNKLNMGVLLAVILDDERSRENFHSIDHNYFGFRLPLASNTGEIIRVGVSQHCEFNSNTVITDNFFEHCDGETEIVSIKSCSNIVRNNLFEECQGGVVLRHGNFNVVENNIFNGNNKEGTGGVRIINKGQWVVNNLFYQCRGQGFRSPLSIMNGVPNSPAFRYVAVTDAVIANNSFIECTPISFCEGSDTERTVPPMNVQFLNNIFSTTKDKILYNRYDTISGITFAGNLISNGFQQQTVSGFRKTVFINEKVNDYILPAANSQTKNIIPDSLLSEGKRKLLTSLSAKPGIADKNQMVTIENNAKTACGAKWFSKQTLLPMQKLLAVNCNSAEEIYRLLKNNSAANLIINLTAKEYRFAEPLIIRQNLQLTSTQKSKISFINSNENPTDFFLLLTAGHSLQLRNLTLNLKGLLTASFIKTDTSGSSGHSNLVLQNCTMENFTGDVLYASKTSVADSIIINRCHFTNITGIVLRFDSETDRKGYYNVEKMKITNNTITKLNGRLLTMLRGGNDESTMGPLLVFSNNKIFNANTGDEKSPLISLAGVQKTIIERNNFQNSNEGKIVIDYKDEVRAVHIYTTNQLYKSGKVLLNQFVQQKNTR